MSEWISVKDGLPEYNTNYDDKYFIYRDICNCFDAAFFDGKNFIADDGEIYREVSHWMKPEAPKRKSIKN